MRDRIAEALKVPGIDYADLRLEEKTVTNITFRGRDLEQISETSELGGNVRALVNGGWGFVSFNDISDLSQKVREAVEHARLVGRGQSELADPPTAIDSIPFQEGSDPSIVPLSEKKSLVQEYNEATWGSSAKIQSTRALYQDTARTTYFANTNGAFIHQQKADIRLSVVAIARNTDTVQQAIFTTGTAEGFDKLKGLHAKAAAAGERAERLLSAKPIKGGEYQMILDPRLAGVFIHEAFGHLSEADFVYENPSMRDILVLGRVFGPPILNVVDGAAIPHLRGSYKYDDEGVQAQRSYLIRGGLLVGRLHSLETAGKMNEQPTGNARAISHQFPPIVRMTNTAIEPGNSTFEEMLADIKEGVYAKGSLGGETRMEMFTFSPEEAFMVRNGRIEEPVRGALLSGNVFTTLQNIDAIGNDLYWSQGGGCGKSAQAPLPVADGSPHIRIARAVVGGL